jgi:hypothetical protein
MRWPRGSLATTMTSKSTTVASAAGSRISSKDTASVCRLRLVLLSCRHDRDCATWCWRPLRVGLEARRRIRTRIGCEPPPPLRLSVALAHVVRQGVPSQDQITCHSRRLHASTFSDSERDRIALMTLQALAVSTISVSSPNRVRSGRPTGRARRPHSGFGPPARHATAAST